MKVLENVERNCCDPGKDLKRIEGYDRYGFKVVFCVQCGRRWRYERERDAAGSMDTIINPEFPWPLKELKTLNWTNRDIYFDDGNRIDGKK